MRRHQQLYDRILQHYNLVVTETWALPEDRAASVAQRVTQRDYSACCKYIHEGRYTEAELIDQYPVTRKEERI